MERSASEPGIYGRGPVQYDSDSLILSDHRREAKVLRKRAEQDVVLMHNRINLLRNEEHKALKKIEETKKRVNSILELRRRNEDRRKNDGDQNVSKDKEMQEIREQNARQKVQHKQILMQNGRNLLNQKREARNMVIDQKLEDARLRKAESDHEFLRAACQHDRIRMAEIAFSQQKRQHEEEVKKQARRAFQERMLADEQTRREKEELIADMEKEEMELIQRLEKTQQRQKSVAAQLEDLLHPTLTNGRSTPTAQGLRPSSSGRTTPTLKGPRSTEPSSTRRSSSRTSAVSGSWSSQPFGSTPQCSSSIATPVAGSSTSQRPHSREASSSASSPQPKMTYTTVTGTTVEVAPEEDLDLFSILNET